MKTRTTLAALAASVGMIWTGNTAEAVRVVEIAERNPRYFETTDGKPWIPIGCNICFDRLYDGAAHGDDAVRTNFDRWLRKFAANGGNCIRLWAGHQSLEAMLVTVSYSKPPLRQLASVPVVWKGLVWATCQDGALYAWDPKTGERKERIFTGAPYLASATVAGNWLYTADHTGRVRCFR